MKAMRKPPSDKVIPLEDSRRFARGPGADQLIQKVYDFARAGDFGGIQELLAKLKFYPGDERYETAMRGVRTFCRERGLPEPP